MRPMSAGAFSRGTVYQTAVEEAQRRQRHNGLPYVHKWWARRLQTTSAALIAAALEDAGPAQGAAPVIYDPFMGMGSLVSAGLAAGCSVAAGDISPVPPFSVRTALTPIDPQQLEDAVARLLWRSRQAFDLQWTVDTHNGPQTMRFALWGKVVPCPSCRGDVQLLRERVIGAFARSPGRIQPYALCPECAYVEEVAAAQHNCSGCAHHYSIREGTVGENGIATCPWCRHRFLPASAARSAGGPREVLLAIALGTANDGTQRFVTPTDTDHGKAQRSYAGLRPLAQPILKGRTTDQVLAWGYECWADLFTPRHLALLAHLTADLQSEHDLTVRAWLALTVSASLDYMSTLCSFRGPRSGGAVRNATAHHILRPALISVENNPLGPRSFSGTLERVFYARILPTVPASPSLIANPAELAREGGRCYVYHGSSTDPHLPDALVDAVVTDPPYFSKIFYQDLAQVYVAFLGDCGMIGDAMHAMREAAAQAVENEDSEVFRERLTAAWRRCLAALRPGGVVAFSFRSMDPAAWLAVARSLVDAGLACYRAEVALAEAPKTLTKAWVRHPSTLDVMLFCSQNQLRQPTPVGPARERVRRRSVAARRRLETLGHPVSCGDTMLIRFGQWVVETTRRELAAPDPWKWLSSELAAIAKEGISGRPN